MTGAPASACLSSTRWRDLRAGRPTSAVGTTLAYLFGWDAAVDWVGQGQDAKAPVWGDLAYMTGWYDGVRDVATARRRACRLTDA